MFFLWSVASASLLSRVDVASLDKDLKERPVSKVLKLLRDMKSTLEKEGEADQEIYDKLACWCETNDKGKSQAIEIAQNRINALTSSIEELTSKGERLNSEIKQLNEEIAKNQDALNKASAIRAEELAEFNGEEKDLLQSVQALGNAVTVLSKHHEMPAEALVNIASLIRHHMHRRENALRSVISASQRRTITAFLQQPAGFQSYAPASGQIFGILKQMKETFESNLSTAQKDELAAREAFEQLKAAKKAEISAAKKQADNKSVELADTDEANAQAKQDLEDTRNALSADQAFLLDLKEKCRQTDAEMAERSKTRSDEILAVAEAIKILSDDDAHDLFGKTLGFTQVTLVLNRESKARRDAVSILKAAAKKTGNLELAGLATAAQLDAFTKVLKAIDEMVTALVQEKADEIKHRDFCVAEFAENDQQTAVQTDERSDLEASIADLSAQIDTLTKEMAELKGEVAESNVQVKRASENREAENKEFQETVADQRATQQILQKALDRLKAFYEQRSLLQTRARQEPGAEAPPPPPGFKAYEKNAGGGGVTSMLQSIITDANNMEKEALRAEQDSQSAYESFVKNTNSAIAAAQQEIVNKQENKARAEKENVQAEADLKASMTDLENLAAYKAQLHKSCDFVMDNFEMRQEARDQEVEALRQAKAVLSGADFQ